MNFRLKYFIKSQNQRKYRGDRFVDYHTYRLLRVQRKWPGIYVETRASLEYREKLLRELLCGPLCSRRVRGCLQSQGSFVQFIQLIVSGRKLGGQVYVWLKLLGDNERLGNSRLKRIGSQGPFLAKLPALEYPICPKTMPILANYAPLLCVRYCFN